MVASGFGAVQRAFALAAIKAAQMPAGQRNPHDAFAIDVAAAHAEAGLEVVSAETGVYEIVFLGLGVVNGDLAHVAFNREKLSRRLVRASLAERRILRAANGCSEPQAPIAPNH